MKYQSLSLFLIAFGAVFSTAALVKEKPAVVTQELIQAAHQVLDLGYDCARSGAERVACHAQLTTAIKERVK